MKVGHRVTVLPGVSSCTDAGSVQLHGKDGASRERFVGLKGEVVAIDGDRVLVDSQKIDNADLGGKPAGICEMREWFLASELEVG